MIKIALKLSLLWKCLFHLVFCETSITPHEMIGHRLLPHSMNTSHNYQAPVYPPHPQEYPYAKYPHENPSHAHPHHKHPHVMPPHAHPHPQHAYHPTPVYSHGKPSDHSQYHPHSFPLKKESMESEKMKDMHQKKTLQEMLHMDEKEKVEMEEVMEEEEKMKKEEKENSSFQHKIEGVFVPECAKRSSRMWCDSDEFYPGDYIRQAIEYHFEEFIKLYADVEELDKASSVDMAEGENENYVCKTNVSYTTPVFAKNLQGRWKMVVNNVELNYKMITQAARMEECTDEGEACPLIPHCYHSKCIQKHAYHRFVVFDEYDSYFPFAIDTFLLPLVCSCYLDEYELKH